MSIMYIREYARWGNGEHEYAQIPKEPAITDQNKTISSSSAISAAFNAATTYICVNCDVNAWMVISSDDSAAVVTNKPLIADRDYYFAVSAGDKIAAITL